MKNCKFCISKSALAITLLLIATSIICGMCIMPNMNQSHSALAIQVENMSLDVDTLKEETSDYKSVGKSAILLDYATGSVIYAKHENDRLPIASMTKIMTTLLILEAVDSGELSLDEELEVSENAASMGGSQVFLDAGSKHKASELLKSIIVASANDSCVVFAERLGGSVEGFVEKMNARANELNMTNTAFKNCTGLPQAESFSSAHDVSIMFCQLIKHPVFFDYSKIWLEDYKHPCGRVTTITNTNKLVRYFKGCDGGKTGFTSEAKFCLAATAQRNGMRLVSVIIGADSSKSRFSAVSNMFNYAFGGFENKVLIKAGENIENSVEILGGKQRSIALGTQYDVAQFMPRGSKEVYELKYELPLSLRAPIAKGEAVGKIYLTKDGIIIAEQDVIALESIERMSLYDAIKDIAKQWSTMGKLN